MSLPAEYDESTEESAAAASNSLVGPRQADPNAVHAVNSAAKSQCCRMTFPPLGIRLYSSDCCQGGWSADRNWTCLPGPYDEFAAGTAAKCRPDRWINIAADELRRAVRQDKVHAAWMAARCGCCAALVVGSRGQVAFAGLAAAQLRELGGMTWLYRVAT